MDIIPTEQKIDKIKLFSISLKNKTIARLLGIVYCHEPITISQTNNQFRKTFGVELNRGLISQYYSRLIDLGALNVEMYSDVVKAKNESKIHSQIKKKHMEFVSSNIPNCFKNATQINNTKYFFLTDFGRNSIESAQEKGGYKLK